MEKFAIFRIGDEDFGININRVVEILKPQKVYSLPELPDFLSGVINVRGEVIPILDFGLRFGIQTTAKKRRIIVVRYESNQNDSPASSSQSGQRIASRNVAQRTEKIGLIVDEIEEIVSLGTEDIISPPKIFRGLKTDYLTGLGKKGDKIIILLNLDRLLTSEEKIFLRESAGSIVESPQLSVNSQPETKEVKKKDAGAGKTAS